MFQFPTFASHYWDIQVCTWMGCPIRTSPDQRLFAPPRSFSQLVTSFFASESQGIRHSPLFTFFVFVLECTPPVTAVCCLLYIFPVCQRSLWLPVISKGRLLLAPTWQHLEKNAGCEPDKKKPSLFEMLLHLSYPLIKKRNGKP